MPFIHVRAWPGREDAVKRNMAKSIVKAASEASAIPEAAFTVVYEDVEQDVWDKEVQQAIIEPLRDKILIERGKPV